MGPLTKPQCDALLYFFITINDICVYKTSGSTALSSKRKASAVCSH